MAGIPSVGQKLTPPQDVTAVAGKAGDRWGANGGDINPCNTKTLGATLANGETANNYQPGVTAKAIGQQVPVGALDRRVLDSSIASGGSLQG